MEKTMRTNIGHYFNHLTCTLFVVLGLLGIFAPASQAATGAFTFSAATYAVGEGAGNVNIIINRVGGSTGAATVKWRTNSATAAFNKDYTSFSWTTLSFAAGETQKTMPVKIINDTLIEPNETFSVSLASPSTGTTVGSISSAVVTIQDNDIAADTTAPTVSLTSPVNASTFTSDQTVTIAATAADNVGINKVEFYDGATLKGTVTTAPYSFAWAITSANNGSHSLTAKAYDAAGNSKVSTAAAVTVNIPLPQPGAFAFSAATYSVDEGAGNVNITINRVGGSTGAATVSWRTNSATATFTQDYGDFGLTSLSFAAGETQKIMPIKIVNDTLIEPNETFKITLSLPTGGTTLGTITSAVVTIQDNDTVAADTTAPTVSLTSPANAATFTSAQTVTVSASASDNNGVSKVELYDGATLKASDTTSPYSFAWTISSANNGSHSLTAKAYDAAGNSKVSSAVTATVNIPTATTDTTAPTVSLTSPANASSFTSAQTVTIAASASDNVSVSKVELYDGATLMTTDTTSPYSFAWTISSTNNGSHSLTAKAYDAAGNSKVSGAATVTVNITTPVVSGPLRAFPGAVGFGTETVAGRGGVVYKVTNLNDSGTGSLRAAVEASGARIVVFEISGTITLNSKINIYNPFLTIAGQTAPSPGITIKGGGFNIRSHDILMQHLRIRVGDQTQADPSDLDSFQIIGQSAYNIVIDHVSTSWAIDENGSTWAALKNVTITNSIFSEGLNNSIHPKGPHSKGFIIGNNSKNVFFAGNLIAHNKERQPRVCAGATAIVMNNVMYNVGVSTHMSIGESGGSTPTSTPYPDAPPVVSAVGNVFIPGPNTSSSFYGMELMGGPYNEGSSIYLSDNKVVNGTEFKYATTANPKVTTPKIWISGLTARPVSTVETWVLGNAGARPADRDTVDNRIAQEVSTRTGGIIDSQNQVGGWPILKSNVRAFPVPTNPNGDDDGDGYTNVEEVIYQMTLAVEGSTAL